MSVRQDSKRPRQSSSDTNSSGYLCQKCDVPVDKVVTCTGCKLAFCTKCAKISDQLYECLISGELDDFHWTCRSCKSMFPTLENIAGTLQDIQNKNDTRMTNIESRMDKLESNTKDVVTLQITNMKSSIIESIKGDIYSVVDQRNKELEDRKRRELNLTIFNLDEHQHRSGVENKQADEQDILNISASLGLENLNIVTSFRLGKKEDFKIRPMKIVLDSKAQRKFLLDNARHIPRKTNEAYHKVIISKDLTLQQREERREVLKTRKQQKTSQTAFQQATDHERSPGWGTSPPTRHFVLREPENVVEMQVDRLPSPIHVANTEHSQLNQLNLSDGSLHTSVFEQSTVININDEDQTLPGGIPSQDLYVGASGRGPDGSLEV